MLAVELEMGHSIWDKGMEKDACLSYEIFKLLP